MDDLVQWLGKQFDEDERIAREADPGPWRSESLGRHDQAAIKLAAPTSLIQFDGSRAAANGMHVSRHDPARVLREIDAKRKLANLHRPVRSPQPDGIANLDCSTCGGEEKLSPSWPCPSLRLLALPYADRPGYKEPWRP